MCWLQFAAVDARYDMQTGAWSRRVMQFATERSAGGLATCCWRAKEEALSVVWPHQSEKRGPARPTSRGVTHLSVVCVTLHLVCFRVTVGQHCLFDLLVVSPSRPVSPEIPPPMPACPSRGRSSPKTLPRHRRCWLRSIFFARVAPKAMLTPTVGPPRRHPDPHGARGAQRPRERRNELGKQKHHEKVLCSPVYSRGLRKSRGKPQCRSKRQQRQSVAGLGLAVYSSLIAVCTAVMKRADRARGGESRCPRWHGGIEHSHFFCTDRLQKCTKQGTKHEQKNKQTLTENQSCNPRWSSPASASWSEIAMPAVGSAKHALGTLTRSHGVCLAVNYYVDGHHSLHGINCCLSDESEGNHQPRYDCSGDSPTADVPEERESLRGCKPVTRSSTYASCSGGAQVLLSVRCALVSSNTDPNHSPSFLRPGRGLPLSITV